MVALKRCTIVAFLLVLAAFVVAFARNWAASDNAAPVITTDRGEMALSVSAGEAALLEGLTAADARDGDLTAAILVESVSPFREDGSRDVAYAVCDRRGNVGRLTRRLTYTDYAPPRFTLSQDLVFAVGEAANVLSLAGALDALDGDLSRAVCAEAPDVSVCEAGEYAVKLRVANSAGDEATATLPLYVVAGDGASVGPPLTCYLVYVALGGAFSAADYLSPDAPRDVEVSGEVDTSRPGVYPVRYAQALPNGETAFSVLNVIVPEEGR